MVVGRRWGGASRPRNRSWSDYHRHDVCFLEVFRTLLPTTWVLVSITRIANTLDGCGSYFTLADYFGPQIPGYPGNRIPGLKRVPCNRVPVAGTSNSSYAEYFGPRVPRYTVKGGEGGGWWGGVREGEGRVSLVRGALPTHRVLVHGYLGTR